MDARKVTFISNEDVTLAFSGWQDDLVDYSLTLIRLAFAFFSKSVVDLSFTILFFGLEMGSLPCF